MFAISRRAVASRAACLGLFASLAMAVPVTARADDHDIAQALRDGGLIIVVRHGTTFPDQADTDPLNYDNVAAQRHLDDNGKAMATALGDALRKIGAPIGKVYTSQYDRAYQTALLAGFTDIEKTADLTEGGQIVSPNENARRTAAFRTRLATPPKAGTNVVFITHQPNVSAALGKEWFVVKEGEASIFRPENGSYTLVARLQIDEWPRIVAAAK